MLYTVVILDSLVDPPQMFANEDSSWFEQFKPTTEYSGGGVYTHWVVLRARKTTGNTRTLHRSIQTQHNKRVCVSGAHRIQVQTGGSCVGPGGMRTLGGYKAQRLRPFSRVFLRAPAWVFIRAEMPVRILSGPHRRSL